MIIIFFYLEFLLATITLFDESLIFLAVTNVALGLALLIAGMITK